MNFTLITVRGPEYHPNLRLTQAAEQRGHSVRLLHPYAAWAALSHGRPGLAGPLDPADLGVGIPRLGATLSDYGLSFIRHLELLGAPLVNNAAAIALARSKFLTPQALAAAGLPVPDTLLINSAEGLDAAVEMVGGWPLVLKEVQGRQGNGVFLAEDRPQALEIMERHLAQRSGLVAQQFIPPQGRRDRRILVLGDRAVAAQELSPPPGDFRSNVHQGGQGREVAVNPEMERLAVAAAKALGMVIAGVDLILDPDNRPYLIEMNYSPGFRGLEEVTGRDIAGEMIDFVEEWATDKCPTASAPS